MKNILHKLSMILGLVFTFYGCSEDIEDDNLEINVEPEVASQLIEDLYAKMYTPGSGGTGEHDDFGHKTYDIFSDLLIGDMAKSYEFVGSGGLAPSVNQDYFGTLDFTNSNNYKVWIQYYSIIEIANTILDLYGGDTADPQDDADRHFFGQALTMRAHSYFYLTQYMANDYDPEALILPIYRESSSDYAPKSTTAEVFQLIENDLNKAIDLLKNYQRPSKKQVNEFMAKAILAYAIAAQRDVSRLNEVVQLCDEVIVNSGATVMDETEVVGGFNNVETPGWIWGVDLTYDMNIGLISWWGQVDYFSYSYAAVGDSKAIDQNLYDEIPIEDVRKEQFSNESGVNYLQPLYKFYDSDRVRLGTTESTQSDYVYMRIAELHLLKAECLAKLGQDVAARMALSEVLTQRLPNVNYLNSLSGVALEDEIYLQTRIEFWGEGKAYLALKRNGRFTGVNGQNHYYQDFIGASFPHNDERLTFEIPQSEIENNPFINEQN
ncbi:RagB/SusD family nutrient uptake outer membrane protein [Winogradskyella echinorum]|uniref:RagB/SusD family nutrient uptake outer membrane protein n=1 Tax=Winogradskyella echinorum TaxID=538189 RepID=A0ABR6XYY3_9FLAO|nr:RagB/SusD family nutrient uptake outer membrane protein [Winogradskyella echinorum]MBC3845686.1 RagB/SusD family nutrient uptake outer membrane protein [Winogradskyella echinorum]MBC5750034.1 RagB/SusD family nutrient uptake outer membrane protein [Winogradskyella echinorum]